MSNTRFVTTNRLEGATLLNGTGGGTPARDETSPYLMENAQVRDRYTLWQSAAVPASPLNVDFDLGSSLACAFAGVAGFRPVGALSVGTVAIYTGTGATGPWTSRGSFSLINSPRDLGVAFSSVASRYWRFEMTTFDAFTIGTLWLGPVTDLGIKHSPGAESTPFRNRMETPMPNGMIVVTDLGDAGRDIVLPFAQMSSSLMTTLSNLNLQTGSFILVDADDQMYDVVLRGGRVPRMNSFGLYDSRLELVRLP